MSRLTASPLLVHPCILALSVMLCACGSGHSAGSTESHDSGAAGAGHTAAVASGNASAEDVAAGQRGDVDCPARKMPAPADAPVQDVLGVRPGLTYEQAVQTVLCSNPLLVTTDEPNRGFDFPMYGQTVRQAFSARFAEPRVQKTGQEIMRDMEREATARGLNAVREDMKPGQAKWFVSTMGMPGQEKVIAVAREQWFDEGRNPSVESVTQSLVDKYGTPTQKLDQSGDRLLRWAHDPRGRLITETSPLYGRCNGFADPDGSMNLNADCGIVVQAVVDTMRDNPALALALKVGVVDEAGGYAAVNATEQGLAALDAQRRSNQVRDASKNGQAPSL